MTLSKKLVLVLLPAALALSACASGLPTRVQRFQAMPAPQGQSFFVLPADPEDRGGLEFSAYADQVRARMAELGYTPADSPERASLIVELGYGVDDGRSEVVSYPGSYSSRFGYFGGFGNFGRYRPFYSRFRRGGYYGSPFYYGWDDPYWYSPYGFGYSDVRSYTVYTSYLDLDIKRAGSGESVFEGTAKARSRDDDLTELVPNLVEAMFTNFPGNNGEQVRITVPPPPRGRR